MRRIIFGISFFLVIASIFVISLALHNPDSSGSPPLDEPGGLPAPIVPHASTEPDPQAIESVPMVPAPSREESSASIQTTPSRDAPAQAEPDGLASPVLKKSVELLQQQQDANVSEIAQLKSVISQLQGELKKRGEEQPNIPEPRYGEGKPETILVLGAGVFQPGQVELPESTHGSIDAIVPLIRERSAAKVIVEGHTDNFSSAPTAALAAEENQRFSVMRAEAVARILERRGIPASRIVVRGYGDTRPIASNSTQSGRSRNRRVEIRLVPSPEKS